MVAKANDPKTKWKPVPETTTYETLAPFVRENPEPSLEAVGGLIDFSREMVRQTRIAIMNKLRVAAGMEPLAKFPEDVPNAPRRTARKSVVADGTANIHPPATAKSKSSKKQATLAIAS